ncbi:MAG: methyltransferase [Actinomycetota bacterium]
MRRGPLVPSVRRSRTCDDDAPRGSRPRADRLLDAPAPSHGRGQRHRRGVRTGGTVQRRRRGRNRDRPRRACTDPPDAGEPRRVRGRRRRPIPADEHRARRFLPDEPGTIAGIANFKPWELHAWAEAEHTLRTGEPSFPSFFELGYWDWLEAHPNEAARFNDDMRRRTTGLLAAALPLFDWPHDGTVVDVGGGNGLLLERLLEREPELRGIVFDLPHVAAEAEAVMRTAGLADRVQVAGGNFFEAIPAGHDVYVLARILHDWNDDAATSILDRIREAMQPSARLVLFEAVVKPGAEPDYAKLLDLHMLVLFGARERTRDEWERLLDRSGFRLERIVPTPGLAWIEARTRS